MTREVGEDIGAAVGNLIDVDVPAESGIAWGRFLRIRVELDLSKPLMRGCIIQVEETAPVWMDFRYEHLPTFCYRCSILGHSSNDCIAGRGSSTATVFASDHYESWLRALPVRSVQWNRRYGEDAKGDSSVASSQGRAHSSGRPERVVELPVATPTVNNHSDATSAVSPKV